MIRAYARVGGIVFRAWPAGSIGNLLLGFVNNALYALSSALVLKRVVDAAAGRNHSAIALWLGVLVAALAAYRIVGPWWDHLQAKLLRIADNAIQRALFDAAAAPAGIAHLESPEYADRIELIRTHGANAAEVFESLAQILYQGALLAVAAVALAAVHPVLLVFLAFASAAAIQDALAEGRELRETETLAAARRSKDTTRRLAVGTDAAKEVRLYRMLPHLLAEHARLERVVVDEQTRAGLRRVVRSAPFGLMRAASLAAGIAVIGQLVAHGRASVGDIALAIALFRDAVAQTVWSLGDAMARAARFRFVARHLLWLLDLPNRAATTGDAPAPRRIREGIRLERVGFTYAGRTDPALTEVSAHLPSGSVVAVVGENGAGKSTLVKLLCRFYEPDTGAITVDGVALSDIDPRAWWTAVTSVFQDFVELELLLRESVGVGDVPLISDDQAVRDALDGDLAWLALETQLGLQWPGGTDLSTGQWQKVALARGRMRTDALLIVLDEPTAALDAQAEHEVFERHAAIRRAAAASGAITLLVSHRFSTVRTADVVLVIDDGRIVEQGSHDELIARGGLYAELYRLQAAGYNE